MFIGNRFLHDWASEWRSRRATTGKRLVQTSRIFFVFMTNVRNLINCLFSRENVYFRNTLSYFKKIVKNHTPPQIGLLVKSGKMSRLLFKYLPRTWGNFKTGLYSKVLATTLGGSHKLERQSMSRNENCKSAVRRNLANYWSPKLRFL